MFEMYPKKPHLDNVTGNFIEQVSEAGGKPLYELTPEEAREFLLMIQRNSHKHIPAVLLFLYKSSLLPSLYTYLLR